MFTSFNLGTHEKPKRKEVPLTSRGCLLVSASCIVLPPTRKVGISTPHPVEDAVQSMIALKKRFATDIYILLCTKQYRENGMGWLRAIHCYNENQQDHDIVGTDRVVDFSEDGLRSLIHTAHITHVIADDSHILDMVLACSTVGSGKSTTIPIERYLLGFAPTDDDLIKCFPNWEELTRAILVPWQ